MSELRVSSIKNLSGQDLITKDSLGLGNVDNTSDVSKPVSVATQAAIDAIPTLPAGGVQSQILKKATNADYDVTWDYAPKVIPQRGVTVDATPLILSVSGGSSNATSASEALNLTTDASYLLVIKGKAVAANGLTKTFEISATVKNFTVLESTNTRVFGEVGSESWSLALSWNVSLGSYVLTATGYNAQAITWETLTEVI